MTDSTMPITLPPVRSLPDAERAAVRHVLLRFERGQLSAVEAAQVLDILGLHPEPREWVLRPLTPSGRARAHKHAQQRRDAQGCTDPAGTAEDAATRQPGANPGQPETNGGTP